MSLRDFLKKQFIDVIHWTEPEDGILAWRFPMQDMEIQNGAKLTVRESQMAAFVNEGRMADVFGPGLYTLNTQHAAAPHQPDELGQDVPVAVQDRRLFLLHAPADQPAMGHAAADHDSRQGIRRRPACARSASIPGGSPIRGPSTQRSAARGNSTRSPTSKGSSATRSSAECRTRLPRARCRSSTWPRTRCELGQKIAEHLQPAFAELGLTLDSFVVENLSLPEELQKLLDQRIGMNMIGDMGKYTQFQVAQSMPIAAANEGGGTGGSRRRTGRGLRDGAADDERDAPASRAAGSAELRRSASARAATGASSAAGDSSRGSGG